MDGRAGGGGVGEAWEGSAGSARGWLSSGRASLAEWRPPFLLSLCFVRLQRAARACALLGHPTSDSCAAAVLPAPSAVWLAPERRRGDGCARAGRWQRRVRATADRPMPQRCASSIGRHLPKDTPPSQVVFDRSSQPITNPIGWRPAQLIEADGCRPTVSRGFRKHGTATARSHKTPNGFSGLEAAGCCVQPPPHNPTRAHPPSYFLGALPPPCDCVPGRGVPQGARRLGPPSVVRRRAVAADMGRPQVR